MKTIIARIENDVVEVLKADEIFKLDLKPAYKNWDTLHNADYITTTLAGVERLPNYVHFYKPETDADKFEIECATYDWFYQMSDDGGVWNAGRKHDQRMDELAKILGFAITAPIWAKYVLAKKVYGFRDDGYFMRSYAYRYGATEKDYLDTKGA